jgi:hypothetical protein
MTTATLTYDDAIERVRGLGDQPVTAAVWRQDDTLEAAFGDRIEAVEPHDEMEPPNMAVRFHDGSTLVLDRDEFCGAWFEHAEGEIAQTPVVRVATVDREVVLSVD